VGFRFSVKTCVVLDIYMHMHAVREFTSIESIYAHSNHNKTLGPTLIELRRQRVPQQKSCQTFFPLLHSLGWVPPFFFTSELDLFYEIPSAGGGKHDHFKFRLFVGGASHLRGPPPSWKKIHVNESSKTYIDKVR
jgi:hypothetical protein